MKFGIGRVTIVAILRHLASFMLAIIREIQK